MNILLYRNNEIDKDEWDRQIGLCKNSLIYAYSFYLDHVCPGWYALMDDSKSFFMPLPVRTKMGITYSYQPLFTQQLGVFSKYEINEEIITRFLNKSESVSKDISLYLNYSNQLPEAKQRCNLIIDLSDSFDTISKRFRRDLITKPTSSNLDYATSTIDEVFEFYTRFILPKNKKNTGHHVAGFKTLALFLSKQRKALPRSVKNSTGETISTALFFTDEHRIYYLLAASSQEGRKTSANALLLYEAIKEFSGQQKIFDFEGSEIPGVRFFFEKFGPKLQSYYHYKKDNLNPLQKKLIPLARKIKLDLQGFAEPRS